MCYSCNNNYKRDNNLANAHPPPLYGDNNVQYASTYLHYIYNFDCMPSGFKVPDTVHVMHYGVSSDAVTCWSIGNTKGRGRITNKVGGDSGFMIWVKSTMMNNE